MVIGLTMFVVFIILLDIFPILECFNVCRAVAALQTGDDKFIKRVFNRGLIFWPWEFERLGKSSHTCKTVAKEFFVCDDHAFFPVTPP